MMRHFSILVALLLTTMLFLGTTRIGLRAVSAQEAKSNSEGVRTWTSSDNMFRTEATLLEANATQARLRRQADGVEITTDLKRLSRADREYVRLFLEKRNPKANAILQDLALSVPGVTLELIDREKGLYRAQPLGILNVPKPGFAWQLDENSAKTTLLANKEGSRESFHLTLLPTAVTKEDRLKLMGQDWIRTARSVVQGGATFRNEIVIRDKPRMNDSEWLYFEVNREGAEASIRHQINYCFRSGYTIRIDHAGPNVKPGQSEAEKIIANLHQVSAPAANQLVALTESLKREIKERIELLKTLVEKKDYRNLLIEFLPAADFKKWSESSELARRDLVTQFVRDNGPILTRLVPTLDVKAAWAKPEGDHVVLLNQFELPPIELFWKGRWALQYPEIIPNADLSGLRQEMPEQDSGTAKEEVVLGKELELRELNAEWAVLSPYGKVPIPESGFRWQLTDRNTPMIEAEKGEDHIAIVVLPATPANERADLIKRISFELERELSDLDVNAIQSSAARIGKEPIGSRQSLQLFGRSKANRKEVGIDARFLFLKDKTILLKARSLADIRRSVELARFMLQQLEQQDSWFPKSDLDPMVEREVRALVKDTLGLIEEKKYAELLEKFVPANQLEQMKSNPSSWQREVENFAQRSVPEIAEALQSLDWSAATYDASNQTLRFRGSPASFTKRDGSWHLK